MELPRALTSAGEANAFLKKFKHARESKIALSRQSCLWDISDLAHYLTALERWDEVVEVADFLKDNVRLPEPFNAMIWLPVTYVIRCKYYALMALGCEHEALNAIAYLNVHPGHVRYTEAAAERSLDETETFLARANTGKASDRPILISVLRTAGVFYLEAKAGLDYCEKYPVDRAQEQFHKALTLLARSIDAPGSNRC